MKLVDRSPDDYIQEIRQQDGAIQTYKLSDKDKAEKRLAKTQKHIEKHAEYRKEKYTEKDGGKAHRKNKRRFLSNATHMSMTDPDARIAKKSNKPRMLCCSSMMAVDSKNNVITHMSAERSHKKDSRYLLGTTHSIYKNQYDDMISKLKSEESQRSNALSMKTVEPVFGTLQQYYGLRWINTRGIYLANKVMVMAAAALNLKKLVIKRTKNQIISLFDTVISQAVSQNLNRINNYITTDGVSYI